MATITITGTTPGETFTVIDGPSSTTEVDQSNGLSTTFSGASNLVIDGNNGGDKVVFNYPTAVGALVSLTVQNLGAGGTIAGADLNAASPDVNVTSAGTLALTAAAGIGTAARPLRTQTGTLNAITTTGGVFINNNAAAPGALNIGNGGGGIRVNGASGDISLINNGTINSATNNDAIQGPGNVTVKAQGVFADLNLSGQTGLISVFGSGSGLVDLEAGRDINLGGAGNNSFGQVASNSGSIKLAAGRNLTLNANGYLIIGGNGSITASSGGDFTMLTAPGNIPNGPFIETGGGAIALSAGPGATMTLDSTGPNAVSSSGGNIALTADAMVINKGVNAGGGNVLLQAMIPGQPISLGTALGGFNLTAADLNQVTANTLTIGNAAAASVTVGGAASTANVTNLTIDTGGSFHGKVGSAFTLAAGGTLTINFDMNGQGAVADLSNTTRTPTTHPVQLIGGTGNDVFIPNPLNITVMTGGGGIDTFEGSLNQLGADTITDISQGDKIWFTDGNPNTFQFSLNGTTLSYGNGGLGNTLTLSNAPTGIFLQSADPNGGVDLTYVIPVAVSDNASFTKFDGNTDILFRSASSGQMAYWSTQNGQISGITVLGSAPTSAVLVDTGDFNGDGSPDLLFRNGNQIATWDTVGGHISSINVLGSAPASAQIAGTGDFNGDGTTDLLFRDSNTNQIATWIVVNNQIQSINVLGSAPASAQIVGTADFNHDGTTDILFRDSNTGQLAYWLVKNNQLLGAPQVLGSTSTDWHLVGTADFAGNGNTDLLFASNTTGQVVEWLLNGAQVQSIQTIGTATGYHIVGTGDLNGDGKADIVFRNDAGQVATWLMNGAQLLSAQSLGSASPDLLTAIHHFGFV